MGNTNPTPFTGKDGNHRLAAYKALGIKDVPVIAPKGTVSPSISKSQLTDLWKKANNANQ